MPRRVRIDNITRCLTSWPIKIVVHTAPCPCVLVWDMESVCLHFTFHSSQRKNLWLSTTWRRFCLFVSKLWEVNCYLQIWFAILWMFMVGGHLNPTCPNWSLFERFCTQMWWGTKTSFLYPLAPGAVDTSPEWATWWTHTWYLVSLSVLCGIFKKLSILDSDLSANKKALLRDRKRFTVRGVAAVDLMSVWGGVHGRGKARPGKEYSRDRTVTGLGASCAKNPGPEIRVPPPTRKDLGPTNPHVVDRQINWKYYIPVVLVTRTVIKSISFCIYNKYKKKST